PIGCFLVSFLLYRLLKGGSDYRRITYCCSGKYIHLPLSLKVTFAIGLTNYNETLLSSEVVFNIVRTLMHTGSKQVIVNSQHYLFLANLNSGNRSLQQPRDREKKKSNMRRRMIL